MKPMSENGTAKFTNPDDYCTSIGAANVSLTITKGGDFNARLTWLNSGHLYVLHGRETLPRIAFIALPPTQAFVSFPTSERSPLNYGGFRLQFGDVVFHSPGERLHQRTDTASQWGLISLPLQQLVSSANALTGIKIVAPAEGRILRPSQSDAKRLVRLHSKACRLAETNHELIENPEVARSIEQELLHALVNCLIAGDARGNLRGMRHHAEIMVRFENALTADGRGHVSLPALCSATGVPERTLRVCCTEFLGMSPTRYRLLRRLNLARAELLRADAEMASVAEIARNHRFLELGRFAAAYRTVFDEMPSSTLRRSPGKTT
jgi:AraC-like DNA-binding protein